MEMRGNVQPVQTPVEAAAAPSQSPAPPPRCSQRLEDLRSHEPTAQQMARIEMEEAFARRVAPRVNAAVSVSASPDGAQRRTRSVSRAIRDKHTGRKRRSSPHQSVDEDQDDDQDDNHVDDQDSDAHDQDSDEDDQDEAMPSDEDVDDPSDGDEADSAEEDYADEGGGEERDPQELLVELSEKPVEVPALKVFHRNWDAFKSYLEEYSEATHQVIVVFETMKAEQRNTRVAAQKKKRPDAIVPLHIGPYARVYKCTHGPKLKNHGKDQRPGRFIRFTKCPFRFHVQSTRPKPPKGSASEGRSARKWVLKVAPSANFHNHAVGPDSYGTYPIARGIQDPVVLSRAREMVADGVSWSKIYYRLLAAGENVYKTDVYNFVNANRTDTAHKDENEAVGQAIATFVEQNPDGAVTVDENDNGETGVISMTTTHQRIMLGRFGELMLVDCTHKTNRYD